MSLKLTELPTTTDSNDDDLIYTVKEGVSYGIRKDDLINLDKLSQKTLKYRLPISTFLKDVSVEYDTSKPIVNIDLNDSFVLGNTSIREHSIIFYPKTNKYYLICDLVPLSNPNHPNTYDTEIHLFSSDDKILWDYLGVCVTKGGVGELGEFGVASPSGVSLLDDKIYVSYSCRNNSSFSGRSIGLSFTNTPEVLPWNKASATIPVVDTVGEDDDPSCVTIPSDSRLHIYNRTTSPYRIVHSYSETPEDVNSWSVPTNVTTLPIGENAQELTSAFYADGMLQMYVMEQPTNKVAHLYSENPSDEFIPVDSANRYIDNVTNQFSVGHISPIIKNKNVEGWSWTVNQDGGKYGLGGYEKTKNSTLEIKENLKYNQLKPSIYCDGTNRLETEVNTQYLIDTNEVFSMYFKFRLDKDRVLNTSSDQNMLMSLSNGETGALSLNFRGGTYNGCFFRIYTSSSTFIDVTPSTNISDLLIGGKINSIVVNRDSLGKITIFLNSQLIATSSTNTLVAFKGGAPFVLGSLSGGVVPFYGDIYEFVLKNEEATNTEISNYTLKGIEYPNYINNGSGNGILLHYLFDKANGSFLDLGTKSVKSTIINYSPEQNRGVSKSLLSDSVYFSARMAGVQSIPSSVSTKVIMVEEFDNKGYFTSGRFTPLIAGYYDFNAFVQLTSFIADKRIILEIKKNGSRNCHLTMLQSSYSVPIGCGGQSPPIYLNGTTDYIELNIFQDSGSSRDISSDATSSFFSGKRLNF